MMAVLDPNGGTQTFRASSVGLCQLAQWLNEGHYVSISIGPAQGFDFATDTRVLSVKGTSLHTANGIVDYALCDVVKVTPIP